MKPSRRQREVLQRICRQGMTRKQAADDLYISVDTVKNHITNAAKAIGTPGGTSRMGVLCYRVGLADGRRTATPVAKLPHENP